MLYTNVCHLQFGFSYSEEIFSQQSRKLSGSTCSDAELNSDILFSHATGHETETNYDLQPNITKKDVINLQNEIQSLLDKINKYNAVETLDEEQFTKLKSDIAKSNLNNLLKYDLSVIKNDLQNKYHAELEVLREDGENRFDELRLQYEDKMRCLDEKYREEIEGLKIHLEEVQKQNMSLCSAVQEVVSFFYWSVQLKICLFLLLCSIRTNLCIFQQFVLG